MSRFSQHCFSYSLILIWYVTWLIGLRFDLVERLAGPVRFESRYARMCCLSEPGIRLPPDVMRQLGDVAEAYLTTKLERGFSALDFYKSLLI